MRDGSREVLCGWRGWGRRHHSGFHFGLKAVAVGTIAQRFVVTVTAATERDGGAPWKLEFRPGGIANLEIPFEAQGTIGGNGDFRWHAALLPGMINGPEFHTHCNVDDARLYHEPSPVQARKMD